MVSKLTLRKWMQLFITTLGIGGMTTVLLEMIFSLHGITRVETSLVGLFWGMFLLFAYGMTFSAISQMAFFTYLTLHRFGLGIFKSVKLWRNVQIIIILFAFFDLVYFRYRFYQQPGETWLNYAILPTLLLLGSLIIAYIKARETDKIAFVPAIFLLFVITSVASIPALVLTDNDTGWVVLMVGTIFVCHAWQLLWLHRLNKSV